MCLKSIGTGYSAFICWVKYVTIDWDAGSHKLRPAATIALVPTTLCLWVHCVHHWWTYMSVCWCTTVYYLYIGLDHGTSTVVQFDMYCYCFKSMTVIIWKSNSLDTSTVWKISQPETKATRTKGLSMSMRIYTCVHKNHHAYVVDYERYKLRAQHATQMVVSVDSTFIKLSSRCTQKGMHNLMVDRRLWNKRHQCFLFQN